VVDTVVVVTVFFKTGSLSLSLIIWQMTLDIGPWLNFCHICRILCEMFKMAASYLGEWLRTFLFCTFVHNCTAIIKLKAAAAAVVLLLSARSRQQRKIETVRASNDGKRRPVYAYFFF
jgi:hypothetical protein